jgi:DinB superfamily
MEANTPQQELFIKMVLLAWDGQNNNLHKFLASFTAEQLAKETAPGKNTGIYLLGHLIAVSDSMLPLLGFGERLFPALENVFIKSPDKSGLEKPSVTELKGYLQAVNAKLAEHFQSTTPVAWFGKHTVVSEEDFAKEPYRNKLNIIITRTHHMAYHLGQMALLKR